ncbi:anacyclamide/piricyclamide family prenylated cyclic peptide [Kineosporia succinea]|uniref:Uncharacterized protein n=1 Tax=Kineosporia succinea TaxID=84632 RepID=A0ABT9PBR3_9ACTN|nr:anacyclamide/piricyclamide family prenylated cyclic peptide [Kineosporia succinea]MDP9830118.1 hypothetical protein [Kineosporia succinea]
MSTHTNAGLAPQLVAPVTRRVAGTASAEGGASLSMFFPAPFPPFAGDDDE